jgi:hypothetical protein
VRGNISRGTLDNNQSINQSINQSVNESINQSINQSINTYLFGLFKDQTYMIYEVLQKGRME